ncbi:PaaI family thioesterase [Leptospira sp. WS92.C1]
MPATDTSTQVYKELRKMTEKMAKEYGLNLEIPPKSFKEMKGEFLEIEPKKILVRFPYDARFATPIGVFQGGMLCTALDNTYGPLSYITAKKPCVTTDLSTQFFRSFGPKDEYIEIEAKVIAKSPVMLTMQAEVRNPKKKLIATSTTSMLILQDSMLKRMTSRQEED